ncbi:MAG: response regulator [Anaerolineaceae bacterium]|nr:response regulator [Anaerolineaceae bacterium]
MPKAQALIIDDNSSNILVLRQLLTIEGVASLTLPTARDLIPQLDLLPDIDVVFLDLEMPIMDGYEAVSIIKSHPNFAATKVIAYSVHVSELNSALAMGFDGFLGKPLNAEAFPHHLQRILNGEQVWYLP